MTEHCAFSALTIERGVLLLDGFLVDTGIRQPAPDPEEGVDVHADVEVAPAQQPLSALTLTHLWLVRVDQQVFVSVRHYKQKIPGKEFVHIA